MNRTTSETNRSYAASTFVTRVLWLLNIVFVLSYALTFLIAKGHWNEWTEQTVLPFSPNRMFDYGDFTMYYQKTFHLTTAKALASGLPLYNYPAPAAFIYSAMFHLKYPLATYKACLVLLMTLLASWTIFQLLRRPERRVPDMSFRIAGCVAVMLTCFASYPVIFTSFRGNIEGVAVTLFTAGILCFVYQKNMAAAVLWGLGSAVKPFPILLLLLLLRRKSYLSIAVGTITSFLVQVVALQHLGPSIVQASRDLTDGFDLYKRNYIFSSRMNEARFQHSIFDSMRTLQHAVRHGSRNLPAFNDPAVRHLYPFYIAVALVLTVLLLLRFRRMPSLNQLIAIVLAVLLLPPVSADYTTALLHLPFLLWLVWVCNPRSGPVLQASATPALCMAVCFALIFSAQNWLFAYTGLLHTAILLTLLAMVALVPMSMPMLDESRHHPSSI